MKNLFLIGAATIAFAAMPAAAQMEPAPPPADPAAMPAEEVIQANPPSVSEPSLTPPNPDVAAQSVPPAMPADPSYQAGPYKGALTPPPAEAMNKVYPLCSRTLQDSCRNRGGV